MQSVAAAGSATTSAKSRGSTRGGPALALLLGARLPPQRSRSQPASPAGSPAKPPLKPPPPPPQSREERAATFAHATERRLQQQQQQQRAEEEDDKKGEEVATAAAAATPEATPGGTTPDSVDSKLSRGRAFLEEKMKKTTAGRSSAAGTIDGLYDTPEK